MVYFQQNGIMEVLKSHDDHYCPAADVVKKASNMNKWNCFFAWHLGEQQEQAKTYLLEGTNKCFMFTKSL